MMRRDIMTATRTALTAALGAAVVLAAAAPQIASAATACAVTKAHAVHRVVHRRIHRPMAVAAYREGAPASETRTIVETRYIPEPAPERVIVEPAPVYYGDGYAPYPVYYHRYGYYHPYYHPHLVVGFGFGHRHW